MNGNNPKTRAIVSSLGSGIPELVVAAEDFVASIVERSSFSDPALAICAELDCAHKTSVKILKKVSGLNE